MIERGADLESHSLAGYTPLSTACLTGNVEAVRLLVQSGSQKYVRNSRGESPFLIATRLQEREILKILVDSVDSVDSIASDIWSQYDKKSPSSSSSSSSSSSLSSSPSSSVLSPRYSSDHSLRKSDFLSELKTFHSFLSDDFSLFPSSPSEAEYIVCSLKGRAYQYLGAHHEATIMFERATQSLQEEKEKIEREKKDHLKEHPEKENTLQKFGVEYDVRLFISRSFESCPEPHTPVSLMEHLIELIDGHSRDEKEIDCSLWTLVFCLQFNRFRTYWMHPQLVRKTQSQFYRMMLVESSLFDKFVLSYRKHWDHILKLFTSPPLLQVQPLSPSAFFLSSASFSMSQEMISSDPKKSIFEYLYHFLGTTMGVSDFFCYENKSTTKVASQNPQTSLTAWELISSVAEQIVPYLEEEVLSGEKECCIFNPCHSTNMFLLITAGNFGQCEPIRTQSYTTSIVLTLSKYIVSPSSKSRFSLLAKEVLAYLSPSMPARTQATLLLPLSESVIEGILNIVNITLGRKTSCGLYEPLLLLTNLMSCQSNLQVAVEYDAIGLMMDLLRGTFRSRPYHALLAFKRKVKPFSPDEWGLCLIRIAEFLWSFSFEKKYHGSLLNSSEIVSLFCGHWGKFLDSVKHIEKKKKNKGEKGENKKEEDEEDDEDDEEEREPLTELDVRDLYSRTRVLHKTIIGLFFQIEKRDAVKKLSPPLPSKKEFWNYFSLSSSSSPSLSSSSSSSSSLVGAKPQKEFKPPWVMISYSWASQDVVLKLRDALKHHQIPVWIDVEQMVFFIFIFCLFCFIFCYFLFLFFLNFPLYFLLSSLSTERINIRINGNSGRRSRCCSNVYESKISGVDKL